MTIDTILFKLKDMKVNEIHSFDIRENQIVSINRNRFSEKTISRVEIVKYSFEGMKDSIFITAFMGNLKLCSFITTKDCIVDIDKMGAFEYYEISKVESFD